MALARITNRVDELVPVLTNCFLDDDKGSKQGQTVFVRATSALALGKFGPKASNAVPGLKLLMGQTGADRASQYAAVQAAVALWRIERDAEGVLPFMSNVLRTSSDVHDWVPLLESVAEMGPIAKKVAPDIRAAQESYRRQKVRFHFPVDDYINKALMSINSDELQIDREIGEP